MKQTVYTKKIIFLVIAHIIGKYDGKVFEDRTVSFTVGEGSEANVIDGVERAIQKLKKGETARIIIKPQYGFGSEGSNELGVPPNATVEYVVTLVSFEKVWYTLVEDALYNVNKRSYYYT